MHYACYTNDHVCVLTDVLWPTCRDYMPTRYYCVSDLENEDVRIRIRIRMRAVDMVLTDHLAN